MLIRVLIAALAAALLGTLMDASPSQASHTFRSAGQLGGVDYRFPDFLIMRVVGLLSGLSKHLDSRVDVANTILPYARAAQEGAR